MVLLQLCFSTKLVKICKHYGLSSASNPIIFAKTGRPVGDVNDFIKLAQEKFGIDVSKLTEPINHSVNETLCWKSN